MKKFLALPLLLLFSLTLCAQTAPVDPPYKRFPTLPPFRLLLADSATIVTKDDLKKNRKTLIMLFSPDCDHCQHEARELVKHKEQFKDIQIVLSGTAPLKELQQFYSDYQLAEIPNLIIGKDYQYILPPFFMLKNFPYLALYNKKKELITTFEGAYPMRDILKAFAD